MSFTKTILVFALAAVLLSFACGVKSGDRRPARTDADKQGEFHRSPVAFKMEEINIDIDKTDQGCSATPADVRVPLAARIRLAVQLQGADLGKSATGSITVTGEKKSAKYDIPDMVIKSAAGAFDIGTTVVQLELESGARKNYDFNVASEGAFDILCDGEQIGIFNVTP